MADTETGLKWWVRYVIVPLIAGGGLVAIIVALLKPPDDRPRHVDQPKMNNLSGLPSPPAPTPTRMFHIVNSIPAYNNPEEILEAHRIDTQLYAALQELGAQVKMIGSRQNGCATDTPDIRTYLFQTFKPEVDPLYLRVYELDPGAPICSQISLSMPLNIGHALGKDNKTYKEIHILAECLFDNFNSAQKTADCLDK
jgi:hypothetical protein